MKVTSLIFVLLLITGSAFGVTFGHVAGNWSTDALWEGGVKPTSSNAAVFDNGSASCTIDAASVCQTLTCTDYTGTLTFTSNLAVGGSVTLDNTATYTPGNGSLVVSAAATLISDEESFAVPLRIGTGSLGTATFLFADNWTTTGGVTIVGSAAALRTLTGSILSIAGNFKVDTITTGSISGTTTIVLNGTGTWSESFTTGWIANPLQIAGNVTFSGIINVGGGNSATAKTLTYVSGTVVPGTSNLKVVNGAYTIDCDATGLTLGTLTLNAPTSFTGEGFTCTEMISSIAEGAATSGDKILNGGFTAWTADNPDNWITTETGDGLVTQVAGGCRYYRSTGNARTDQNGKFTIGRKYRITVVCTAFSSAANYYGCGDAVNFSSSRVNSVGTFVFDITAAHSDLVIRYNGTGSIDMTLSSISIYEIPTHTFASGKEWIVTDSLKLAGVSALQPVVLQSSGASYAYLTLQAGAKQGVSFVSHVSYPLGVSTLQWINSANGRRVYDKGGVLGNTVNWSPFNKPILANGQAGWGRTQSEWGR